MTETHTAIDESIVKLNTESLAGGKFGEFVELSVICQTKTSTYNE